MEKNVEEPLPVTEICRQIRLSGKMLELLCKRHLGVTPGSYYRRLRLQTARKLVIDSRLSMQEIGIRCGFNSQSNFSRAFQNFFGYPPRTLRRQ